MSDSNSSASSGGIGFCSLLTVLFIGLKLTDHIDWSWGWVLSPLWIPVTAFVVIFSVCLLVLLIGSCLATLFSK